MFFSHNSTRSRDAATKMGITTITAISGTDGVLVAVSDVPVEDEDDVGDVGLPVGVLVWALPTIEILSALRVLVKESVE